jgi:hypothetical protein
VKTRVKINSWSKAKFERKAELTSPKSLLFSHTLLEFRNEAAMPICGGPAMFLLLQHGDAESTFDLNWGPQCLSMREP